MNTTINGDVVLVTLSRTNLRTLLHKLDNPGSLRTLCRSCENGVGLIVHAEEDEEHYGDRKRGVMSPDTEVALLKKERGRCHWHGDGCRDLDCRDSGRWMEPDASGGQKVYVVPGSKAERKGRDDAHRQWWQSNPDRDRYDCDEANRHYADAWTRERGRMDEERREEERAEERRAEMAREERRREEQAYEQAAWEQAQYEAERATYEAEQLATPKGSADGE